MKHLYSLLAAVSLAASVHAQQTINSIANGNATNIFTWDCTCIPSNGDIINISHTVTLDVDYAYTMGGIHILPAGTVNGNTASRILGVSGGFLTVDGTLNIGFLYHSAGTLTNNGNITVAANMAIDQSAVSSNLNNLNVLDTMYINTSATLNNSGTFSAAEMGSAGTVNNTGSMTSGNILNTGTFTHSGSNLTLGSSFYNTGTVNLNNAASVAGDVWNAENFNVMSYMNCQSLINGDTIFGTAIFKNDGTISCANSLFNSEDINGSGDFCIADSSVNSGAITGTVDICDQTGGTWDFNFGTEAGTVTHCAAGPCSIGITEVLSTEIGIMPNPSSDIIRLQLPHNESGLVQVMDITGRLILTDKINGTGMSINIGQLPEGMYTVKIAGGQLNYTGRFVKQ